MDRPLAVAALELPARWDRHDDALADVDRLLASGPPIDLALLPEASLTGYVSPGVDFDLSRFAESLDGPTARALAALAEKHACHLAGPIIERAGARLYNAVSVFSPAGERIAHYRKRHPWYPEAWATPGGAPPPVFDVGGARVTFAICFDLHFVAADAAPALEQADVLLFPSAWVDDRDDARAALLPTLARRFDVAVVNANWGLGDPRVRGQGRSRILAKEGAMLAASPPGADGALRLDAQIAP